MRQTLKAAGLAALLTVGAGVANAAPIFTADFNSDSIGIPATSLMNFTIDSGTVDVIGAGSSFNFSAIPDSNGRYLDLDGTTNGSNNPASQISSNVSFGPGTYSISFQLAGSQRPEDPSVTNTTDILLGNTLLKSYTLAFDSGLTTYTLTATVTGAPVALTFREAGASDNIGNLLDNVSVSAVPLPASAPLFGAALLGLAGLGYMAKRKKAAAAA